MTGPDYLFVDGSYLRETLSRISRRCFDGQPLQIDADALTASYYKTFYYDCLPARDSGEDDDTYARRIEAVQSLFKALRRSYGVHVIEGTISGEAGRKRQKKIDISIAVDMLTHAHRRNMGRATLLAGDLDFKPLIDALIQDGMYVTLWYEPVSCCDELIESADAQTLLNAERVYVICPAVTQFCARPSDVRTRRSKRDKQPIAVGSTPEGGSVQLWEGADYFLIEFESTHNPDTVREITHADRRFLERYARDVVSPFEWKEDRSS